MAAFTIEDDGAGMDPATVRQLNGGSFGAGTNEHIGLQKLPPPAGDGIRPEGAFYGWIPLPARGRGLPSASPGRIPGTKGRIKMNLLLVDDERIAVRGMMQGVDWKGCGVDGEVLTAYNAAQALSVLEETPVSLILCDIEMPGESGIDLIRQVRARWPKTACIFLTCHADFTYAQEALWLGCLDYILKPAPYESIEAAVKKAVSGLKQAEEQETLLRYGSDWLSRQQESAAGSPAPPPHPGRARRRRPGVCDGEPLLTGTDRPVGREPFLFK